jgi:hypothetical protein
MALDIFSTITLQGVIQLQAPEAHYWLDNFFPREVTFDTEDIAFEELPTDRRMAPFVSPRVQGRIMKEKGRTSKTFRPAYVKPKHEVNPFKTVARRAGERIGGDMTREQRWNLAVADNMKSENDMIDRRLDWLAAQAVQFGGVTIVGEDYPEVYVDFQRNAGLTRTLLVDARWGEVAGDPLQDLRELRRISTGTGNGGITRLTMGLDAFDLFFDDDKVRELLRDNTVSVNRTSDSTMSAFSAEDQPAEYRGVLQGANGQGRIEVYTYAQQYEDYDGTLIDMMNPLDVIGTGNVNGIRAFGAIMDKRAGLRALSKFPKMWDVEDPSQTFTMTQSAPLMIPDSPNRTFRIRVA